MYKKIVIGTPEFEGISMTAYKLQCVMREAVEQEYGTVGNTTTMAMIGYNPFSKNNDDYAVDDENLTIEKEDWREKFHNKLANNDSPILKKYQDNKNESQNKALDDKIAKNHAVMKNNLRGLFKGAMSNISHYSEKVDGFTKSSVAKVNDMPIEGRKNAVNQIIKDASNEPYAISDWIKKGVKYAGGGLAMVGLATVSLPLAAGAYILGSKVSEKQKQDAAKKVKKDMILIDTELKKAERDGDLDKQADLLILKRTSQQAYNKIKWGIETDPNDSME